MARRVGIKRAELRSLWTALVALCLLVSPGLAANGADSEALIKQGIELRRKGQHFEAFDLFRRAYELSPRPRATAQLGLVEYALGRWTDAEEHLAAALKPRGDSWIESNRAVLEESLVAVRSHVAQVELRGEPAGAEVIVNGRLAGTLPLPHPVRAGEGFAEIEVRAPDHAPARRTLTLKGRLTQQLFVKLERLPPSGSLARASAPVAQHAETSGLKQVPPVAPADRGDSSGRSLRSVSFVVGGVGLLAGGYGVWQSVRVAELTGKYPRGSEKAEEGETAARRQWWGYGIGAVSLIAAGTLYYFGAAERPASSARVRTTIGYAYAPGGGMATMIVHH